MFPTTKRIRVNNLVYVDRFISKVLINKHNSHKSTRRTKTLQLYRRRIAKNDAPA